MTEAEAELAKEEEMLRTLEAAKERLAEEVYRIREAKRQREANRAAMKSKASWGHDHQAIRINHPK